MSIIDGPLDLTTPGAIIDALIIVNIRMWHAQELIYEEEIFETLSQPQLVDYIRQATQLNLDRNSLMDRLDAAVAALFVDKFGENILQPRADAPIDRTAIWELP
jgi:hypothetical protein